MYESFYQLATNPFRLAPDPNFCFTHASYACAREYLEYALAQGEGFVMVTGRPGTGKTMLAETFLQAVDASRVSAKRITASNYTADDLLRSVAYAYDIDAADVDKATLRHHIQRYFLDQEQAGRRVLLIIDEAQALQNSALEELRILADLQTQSRQMLQLFLIGQESLQDLMRTPEMEQFQQRVIANYHLVPLNLIDARAYIEFRLIQAGWIGDPEFTSGAVLSIYQISRGVPRHINKVCNRLMLLGYGKGAHTIDEADVHAISLELRDELLAPMESNRALCASPDNISTIPEIHDSRYSMDSLAINAENLDDQSSAASESSRHAAQRRAQFDARHEKDPVSWDLQQTAAAEPLQQNDVTTYTAAPDTHTNAAELQPQDGTVLNKLSGQYKWREALIVTTAALALTTISIAALPSLFGERAEPERLSIVEEPQLPMHVATLADNDTDSELSSPEIPSTTAHVTSDPSRHHATAEATMDVVVAPAENAPVQVALLEVPEVLPSQEAPVDALPVPDNGAIEQDNDPAMPVGNVLSDTAAKPTDEVDVPQPESDTRTAFGKIDRQPYETRQQPGEHEVVQTAAVETLSESAVAALETRMQELLLQGQQCLDEFQLMTPAGNNAYGYFSAALALDPANQAAQAGIQQIVDIYVTLIRKEVNRQQTARAARYMDRGLSIQPGNRQLLALRSSLDSAAPTPADVVVVERSVPAVQGSVTSKERTTRDDMMSRITTFFEKRKAEAERGETSVPAGWDG